MSDVIPWPALTTLILPGSTALQKSAPKAMAKLHTKAINSGTKTPGRRNVAEKRKWMIMRMLGEKAKREGETLPFPDREQTQFG